MRPCAFSGSNVSTFDLEIHVRVWRDFYQFLRLASDLAQVKKVYSPNLSKRKCINEVVRIGSTIIFHLSKLWKAKFFIMWDVIFHVKLQGLFELMSLGSERVNRTTLASSTPMADQSHCIGCSIWSHFPLWAQVKRAGRIAMCKANVAE